MRTFSSKAAFLLALALPATAAAQDAGKGFLFGAPSGSFTLRGGWAAASAHSDLFDFTTHNLRLNRGDFSSPEAGMDLAFRAGGQTDVVPSISLSGMNKRSDFRGYEDDEKKPIEQTTTFRRV